MMFGFQAPLTLEALERGVLAIEEFRDSPDVALILNAARLLQSAGASSRETCGGSPRRQPSRRKSEPRGICSDVCGGDANFRDRVSEPPPLRYHRDRDLAAGPCARSVWPERGGRSDLPTSCTT